MKPNNTFYLKCTERSFYRTWVEFLAPYHHLTAREMDVLARLIMQYCKLRASIDDVEVLRDVLWSRSSRKDMMDSLGMTQAHFQMVLSKMKKLGILDDGQIKPQFLPHFGDSPRLMLCVLFDWSKPDDAK